ncbi:hypothetical protein HHI36_005998 [Cryptolaemus montrouzieri]|uniref:Methylenetetrahydrofolate reductase (NAD(P)H) n=1 Tax=Cryptolaemus montrouzieri TaxID=559131 RepID=A0ABD2NWY1_9CUCU
MIPQICNKKITANLSVAKKCISVEVNTITWIGTFEGKTPAEIPPVKLAKELIQKNQTVLLHIPGRNLNEKMALDVLNYVKDIGVRNILALKGQSTLIKEKDDTKVDFPYASNFVEFIKKNFDDCFAVGVAGYPEMHPASNNFEEDMKYLKLKVSSGADFILTQASFQYSAYEEFYERCYAYSIFVPIFLGLAPLNSWQQMNVLKNFCKISMSIEIYEFVEKNREQEEAIQIYGKKILLEMSEKF